MGFLRQAVPILVLGLVLAACAPAPITPGPSGTGSVTPQGSGAATACATAPDPGNLPAWAPPAKSPVAIPVLINSAGALTCGPQRFMFSFLSAANIPIAAPSRTAKVAFYDLGRDATKPVVTEEATFVWGIENVRGIYVAPISFTEAGVWGAEITTSAPGAAMETTRSQFSVLPASPVVQVGQPAPASKTPTATDAAGIARIATDPSPDPAFYTTSVDQAEARHVPFVLVFATPKFCVSAQCGPTLDRVKGVASKFPSVTFINVEPYELAYANGQLQPVLDAEGQLQTVQASRDWGLLSEPWIFVVNRTGIVTASFEGVVGTDELSAAVAAVK